MRSNRMMMGGEHASARALVTFAATLILLMLASVGMSGYVATQTRAAPRNVAANATDGALAVFVAYAEDKEFNRPNAASFPTPWSGAPNTIFLGNPVVGQSNCGSLASCYDSGAIRLDNTGATDIAVSGVSVDDHSSIAGGKVFNLWGSFTVPAGKSVILTQDPPGDNPGFANFDTSSYPNNNCAPLAIAPTVTITIGGAATTLVDSTHVLDTGGIDRGSCTPARNESIQWRPIGASGADTATLTLGPTTTTQSLGHPVTETATLLDGSGVGLPNATVNFAVTTGPNAGETGSASTDAAGQARFTYMGDTAGADTVVAAVTTIGTFTSNQAGVTWSNGGPPPPPAPVQLSGLTVADTANAAKWALQSNLQTGVAQYGDRSYTFTSIPSALAGVSWIRTANASKSYTGAPTVTFTIGQQAMIYVALDIRLAEPGWMDATWIDTGLTLTNNNAASAGASFLLYGKVFPAGTVTLGPNTSTGTAGVNMYTIIAAASGAGVSPTPTPTATPTISPTPPPARVQLSNLVVADSANAAKWALQTNLQSGVTQYGDRGYILTSVPAALAGAAWLRTANGSKSFSGSPLVAFTINQQATVYVALDTRVTPLPTWLDASWTNTGLTLTNSEATGANTFALYAKVFPAASVTLGPNSATGVTACNMYSVLVQ